ncbi:MAG: TetR family transcriptional regulator [Dehalococcoidia bacterium]
MKSTEAKPARRRGPRPEGDSRREILAAARELFAARGYQATTTRAVALQAGVDVSLIHHYFGTKTALFQAAIELPRIASEVVARLGLPEGDAAEGVARLYLEQFFAREAATFSAMLRTALGSPNELPQLRRIVEETMVGAAAHALEGPDAALRAEIIAAQFVGLFVLRHIVGVAPLANASTEELLRYLVPSLRTYFERSRDEAVRA